MDANLFFLLKMTHIAALIFWLGPSLGAWWIVRGFRQRYPDDSEESLLAHRLFITALTLEHVAFVALLLSGIAMVMVFSFHWQPWLQWKIMIIAIFLIPLEAADIYWGNIKLARLLKSRRIDEGSINYQRTLIVDASTINGRCGYIMVF